MHIRHGAYKEISREIVPRHLVVGRQKQWNVVQGHPFFTRTSKPSQKYPCRFALSVYNYSLVSIKIQLSQTSWAFDICRKWFISSNMMLIFFNSIDIFQMKLFIFIRESKLLKIIILLLIKEWKLVFIENMYKEYKARRIVIHFTNWLTKVICYY